MIVNGNALPADDCAQAVAEKPHAMSMRVFVCSILRFNI